MLKQLIHKAIRAKHTWRGASYSQLNQLYLVMFIRGISLSIMGLFVPMYLYNLKYSLTSIAEVLAIFFATRALLDIAAGFLVARFGPKHILFTGQLFFVVSSGMLLTLSSWHWSVYGIAVVWGISQSLSYTAFDVDFSKVKHKNHGGKELGYAEILSSLGGVLGPILGGVISYLFGARYIFAASTILLLGGLMPILSSPEPVRLKQKLRFKDFPLKKTAKILPSFIGFHIENAITINLWPLYMAIFVFAGAEVYLSVGLISAVSMLIAITAWKTVGQLTDDGYGRQTLRISSLANACIHVLRSLVKTSQLAVGVTLVNQIITPGYRLPFNKAHYDHADDLAGHRIVYLSLTESLASVAKALVFAGLALLSTAASDRQTLMVGFFIATFASILILAERYPSLRTNYSKSR